MAEDTPESLEYKRRLKVILGCLEGYNYNEAANMLAEAKRQLDFVAIVSVTP